MRTLSRRTVVSYGFGLPVSGAFLFGLTGCEEQKVALCINPNELSLSNNSLRKANAYVDVSPQPEKQCAGCAFYRPQSAESQCGACEIFGNSPVSVTGYCNSWAERTAT